MQKRVHSWPNVGCLKSRAGLTCHDGHGGGRRELLAAVDAAIATPTVRRLVEVVVAVVVVFVVLTR